MWNRLPSRRSLPMAHESARTYSPLSQPVSFDDDLHGAKMWKEFEDLDMCLALDTPYVPASGTKSGSSLVLLDDPLEALLSDSVPRRPTATRHLSLALPSDRSEHTPFGRADVIAAPDRNLDTPVPGANLKLADIMSSLGQELSQQISIMREKNIFSAPSTPLPCDDHVNLYRPISARVTPSLHVINLSEVFADDDNTANTDSVEADTESATDLLAELVRRAVSDVDTVNDVNCKKQLTSGDTQEALGGGGRRDRLHAESLSFLNLIMPDAAARTAALTPANASRPMSRSLSRLSLDSLWIPDRQSAMLHRPFSTIRDLPSPDPFFRPPSLVNNHPPLVTPSPITLLDNEQCAIPIQQLLAPPVCTNQSSPPNAPDQSDLDFIQSSIRFAERRSPPANHLPAGPFLLVGGRPVFRDDYQQHSAPPPHLLQPFVYYLDLETGPPRYMPVPLHFTTVQLAPANVAADQSDFAAPTIGSCEFDNQTPTNQTDYTSTIMNQSTTNVASSTMVQSMDYLSQSALSADSGATGLVGSGDEALRSELSSSFGAFGAAVLVEDGGGEASRGDYMLPSGGQVAPPTAARSAASAADAVLCDIERPPDCAAHRRLSSLATMQTLVHTADAVQPTKPQCASDTRPPKVFCPTVLHRRKARTPPVLIGAEPAGIEQTLCGYGTASDFKRPSTTYVCQLAAGFDESSFVAVPAAGHALLRQLQANVGHSSTALAQPVPPACPPSLTSLASTYRRQSLAADTLHSALAPPMRQTSFVGHCASLLLHGDANSVPMATDAQTLQTLQRQSVCIPPVFTNAQQQHRTIRGLKQTTNSACQTDNVVDGSQRASLKRARAASLEEHLLDAEALSGAARRSLPRGHLQVLRAADGSLELIYRTKLNSSEALAEIKEHKCLILPIKTDQGMVLMPLDGAAKPAKSSRCPSSVASADSSAASNADRPSSVQPGAARTRSDRSSAVHLHPPASKRKQWSCPRNDCLKTFSSQSSVKRHLLSSHADTRPRSFVCEEGGCGRSFYSRANLKWHVEKCHLACDYLCAECAEEFFSEAQLRLHMSARHSITQSFRCVQEGCSRQFESRRALMSHQRLHEPPQARRIDGQLVNQRGGFYLCPFAPCAQQFLYLSKLRAHLQTHIRLQQFRCETCNKCFSNNSNLRQHCRQAHSSYPSSVASS